MDRLGKKLAFKGGVAVCITAALAHYWGHLDTAGIALMYVGMVSVGVILGCRSALCTEEQFPIMLKMPEGKRLLQQVFQVPYLQMHSCPLLCLPVVHFTVEYYSFIKLKI